MNEWVNGKTNRHQMDERPNEKKPSGRPNNGINGENIIKGRVFIEAKLFSSYKNNAGAYLNLQNNRKKLSKDTNTRDKFVKRYMSCYVAILLLNSSIPIHYKNKRKLFYTNESTSTGDGKKNDNLKNYKNEEDRTLAGRMSISLRHYKKDDNDKKNFQETSPNVKDDPYKAHEKSLPDRSNIDASVNLSQENNNSVKRKTQGKEEEKTKKENIKKERKNDLNRARKPDSSVWNNNNTHDKRPNVNFNLNMNLHNSVDTYINQFNNKLQTSSSRILRLPLPSENKKNNKNEASIDDILYGGFLNIYKPVNLYSMKVCERVKHVLKKYFSMLNQKKINIKVGHGGTLDPFAEGVLMIGVQKGTKKLTDFLKCYKTYLALAIFGIETDTLDREGNITKVKEVKLGCSETEGGVMHRNDFTRGMMGKDAVKHSEIYEGTISRGKILENLKNFTGWTNQTPPLYSAKRVKGLRLYEYARKNIPVHIKSSKIYISYIKYLNEIELPFLDFQIHCSGGTYIRSLIRDFAYSLKNYATLIKLIRIQQNVYSYADALHYDDINIDNIKKYFIKL
ncbi:tRNA pseudouridine synthase, putative [Plasmodium malariae]|uniref:tRNA pseudouridine(55) synthase n=1 Tax=Plasmodium malariae TaxID=5858 RepID=A0A1D3JHA7_PLAMA|nr:tRNA pseudouridine synthase, putative [Plasmodium malariae]SBT85678.1 tRNA pseudouridine synthase, putative [Plasmodium malariae]